MDFTDVNSSRAVQAIRARDLRKARCGRRNGSSRRQYRDRPVAHLPRESYTGLKNLFRLGFFFRRAS
jgi:hypothetical protein